MINIKESEANMNNNKKDFVLVIDIMLFTIFLVCNWMMDVSQWMTEDRCATNGFIDFCNNVFMHHLFWYVSIVICIYFFTKLVLIYCEVEGV